MGATKGTAGPGVVVPAKMDLPFPRVNGATQLEPIHKAFSTSDAVMMASVTDAGNVLDRVPFEK